MAAWSDNEPEAWEGVLRSHSQRDRRAAMELVQALREFTAAIQHASVEGLIGAAALMLLIYAFVALTLQN
jgi:selenophosphate synthetase-related protein